jgi:DNA-binding transcriptional regulator YiaG
MPLTMSTQEKHTSRGGGDSTKLQALATALAQAMVVGGDKVLQVVEQAFDKDPALAASDTVKLGFKIGADLALQNPRDPIPARTAKWLAELAAKPSMPTSLRTIREALEMSQGALGLLLGGYEAASVSRWEDGSNRMPEDALAGLIRLAKKRGVDPHNPIRPPAGNSLRRLRQSMGVSRSQIGELLGLSELTVKIYESRREPPAAVLRRIEALQQAA